MSLNICKSEIIAVCVLPWFIERKSVAGNRMCSTDQGQVGEQVGDQGQVGEQSRQRWQEPWERNWECWQNSKPANNQQIITKVELYCQTPVPAMPCSTKRDLVKMHIMASYILFWWYEEGKSGRVQFILLQRGNFVISRPWIVTPGGQLARISLATEVYSVQRRISDETGNCTNKKLKDAQAQNYKRRLPLSFLSLNCWLYWITESLGFNQGYPPSPSSLWTESTLWIPQSSPAWATALWGISSHSSAVIYPMDRWTRISLAYIHSRWVGSPNKQLQWSGSQVILW